MAIVGACAYLLLTAFSALFLALAVGEYRDPFVTYDELKRVTYTYRSSDRFRERDYVVNVEEEGKPLGIFDEYAEAVDRNALKAVREGEQIDCFVRETQHDKYSYEVVELKTKGAVVMSLQNWNKAARKNSIVGMVVLSFLTACFLALSIYEFVNYGKSKQTVVLD